MVVGKRLTERQMKALCAFCCLAYFVSYLTRLDYAACMVEIQSALRVGKSEVGLPVTLCFISYGIGQLVFGYLGDRGKPQNLIFTGLAGAAGCNFLVALFPRMGVMAPVWCLNGVFQSMLWPPMVRFMAEMLTEEWYRKCCVLVSMASSAATMAVYLFTPACIRLFSWRAVFSVAAMAGIATALVWIVCMGKYETGAAASADRQDIQKDGPSLGLGWLLSNVPLIPILAAIIFQGILRDGITTWMPVYMSEVFHMSNAASILSAAVLPVFSIIATLSASAFLRVLKNEVLTAAVLFGVSIVPGSVMLLFSDSLPGVCIGMMTLMTGCMHGINLMLISRLPGHFARFGRASFVSGILNAATYVGSALSSFGFGVLAERRGWNGVIALWVFLVIGGMAVLLAVRRRWERFCE